MAKIEIVKEIKRKLKDLGVSEGGCYNLNIILPNGDKINWVGYNQVMVGHKIATAAYRNKRYPLYSKQMTSELLTLIEEKLFETSQIQYLIGKA